MTDHKSASALEQDRLRAQLLKAFGDAWRNSRSQAEQSWRETVTHFKPKPWLVAQAHEKARKPVKLRALPAASR